MILYAIRDNVVIDKLSDANKEVECVERIKSGDILLVVRTQSDEQKRIPYIDYFVLTASGKSGWLGLVHNDLIKQL